ncbi:MAG: DNA repair protein RecO [Minisyncoccia bacterium]
MLIKTEGIILTKKIRKEKSSIIYILTKNLGLIKAIAEGLRKEDSKLLSISEPGVYGKMAFIYEYNKYKFITILPYKIPVKIFKKYPYTYLWALRFLLFFNFYEVSQKFWDIIINLDKIILKSPKSFRLWFIIKILEELGMLPNLTNCSKCNIKLKDEIYIRGDELFCGKCKKKGYMKINPSEYKEILKFVESNTPLQKYPIILKSLIKSHLKSISL